MRITGWTIEGFGTFRDFEVRDLPAGATVFLGPNEAGKSTLLAFLRGVLFGYRGSRRSPEYLPLRGGRHGGRLFLECAEGELTVERLAGERAARVYLPGGEAGTEDDLRRVLGGCDDGLFRSVFAFGLHELQSFASLSDDGVKDRIFSAGIAGAGRSAREVLRGLETDADRLLRPRAGARINDLVRELEERGRALADAKRAAARYPELVAEEERWRRALDDLETTEAEAERSLRRSELLVEAWPMWVELDEARSRLSALPVIESFPADPDARLAEGRQKSAAAEEELTKATAAHTEATSECDALRGRPADALAAVAASVESLHERIELYREQLRQRDVAGGEREQAQAALDAALRDLGGDWDEARLEALDRSIPRREEVREWEQRLEAAAAAVAEAARDHGAAEAAARAAEQDLARAEPKGPAAEPADPAMLHRQESAVRRLRANLAERGTAEAKRDARRSALEERERALRDATRAHAAAATAGLAPPLLVAALAALGFAGWKLWTGDVETAIVAFLLALSAGIAWVRTRAGGRPAAGQPTPEQELAARKAAVKRAREELDAAETELRRLAESVARDATLLGVASPSLHDVEELDARLAAEREERRRWDEARRALALAAERLEAAREAERLAAERAAGLRRAEAAVREEWEAWKTTTGLPPSLMPQGALDFFGTLREAAESAARRDAARGRFDEADSGIQDWETRAREAIATARGGWSAPESLAGEPLVQELIGVRALCDEDRAIRARLAAIEAEEKKTAARLAAARARVTACAAELDALFAEAGVTGEAAFRERLAAYRERRGVEEAVRALEGRLTARLGQGPDAAALRDALAGGRLDEWRDVALAAARELEELKERRDEAIRRHRDAEAERQTLERSADVAALETERAALLAELEEAAHAWRVAAVARGLIDQTLRDFERTRQPRVLAAASAIFSTVTTGRYERILQDDAASDLVILDRAGGRRRTGDLSRGTAEQLYLSLRLALVSEFARRTAALPLVLDDVLVNFDPGRGRAMAAALADVAREHQVLLFTCHPATAELFVDVRPDTYVHPLERAAEPAVGVGREGQGALAGSDQAASAPATDSGAAADLAGARSAVLDVLADAAAPLRKAEILAATGIDDRLWARLIRDLTATGVVVQTGERRGAAYALAGEGR